MVEMEDRQRRNNIYITGVSERGKTKQQRRNNGHHVKQIPEEPNIRHILVELLDFKDEKKKYSRPPSKKIKQLRKANPLD